MKKVFNLFTSPNERTLQVDEWNCGLYVLYNVEYNGTNVSMQKSFNPDDYRRTVAQTLLIKSKSMKDMCMLCFNNQLQRNLVKCDTCKRYTHIECLADIGLQKTLEEWQMPSVQYVCFLCKTSKRPWMKA